MSWLVGALVGLAVAAGAGMRTPPVTGAARASSPGGQRQVADLAATVTAVAARLRAGSPPDQAWAAVLGVVVHDGRPSSRQLAGPARRRRPWAGPDGGEGRVAAVLAACRVADELGAPLAPTLDLVAQALVADVEAAAQVRAALAGPRTSARVVGWLPVLGLLLGAVVGADPVAVLTSGGVGTAAGVGGLVLLGCGHVWIALLVRRAQEAGR